MRKAISLFLVFSVLALSGDLFAKERKGADLIIKKIDGQQVRGRLIAVKENSPLLLDRESGADVSVNIGEISTIKKSLWGNGLLLGSLIDAGFGTVATPGDSGIGWYAIGALGGALAGSLIGLIIASAGSGGINEKIHFKGKSDSEIKEILEKLRKNARVRNAR
ncbi:MAG: hypothetical protein JSV17_02275 [Candidatus Aminicenantes bacterium]|nr:MAG: hypothetical protein JSV17_02275 [Candidatus Aminicenantes bacterium]